MDMDDNDSVDSNGVDSNSTNNPTGNVVIDTLIIPNEHLFENGFFIPRSIHPDQNRIPIDLLSFMGNKRTGDLFWTTEGAFLIVRDKNTAKSFAQILRDILVTMDRIGRRRFPNHYQDMIIRQVIGQTNELPPHALLPARHNDEVTDIDEANDDEDDNY